MTPEILTSYVLMIVFRTNTPLRVLLDAYSRRHEAQKIWLRQEAAQRWVDWRSQILQGQRPSSRHTSNLAACDQQLRAVRIPILTS